LDGGLHGAFRVPNLIIVDAHFVEEVESKVHTRNILKL